MSVVVVETNKLCPACIYLPAEDIPDDYHRLTAVEMNDLCTDCATKGNIVVQGLCYSDPVTQRVIDISPYHKGGYK